MADVVVPQDAATVMLVRDVDTLPDGTATGGIEVFMLRRNLKSDFVGGAYVFPGGKVDPADREHSVELVCHGRTHEDASRRLSLESGGLAFWVAAVRECFEEAGVLLAYDDAGNVMRLDDPEVKERFERHRTDVYSGGRRLVDVCAEENLRLTMDEIHYFSHWITPAGQHRRFDTRFFVAAAPAGQHPLHDDGETIASLWISPEEALARGREGGFELIFPTQKSLEKLSTFSCVAELMTYAAARTDIPTVLPKVRIRDGGIEIVVPGDDGYDEL
jgi:8-oxo-dGTP pyrophosphatase MutT (NUDIX family)